MTFSRTLVAAILLGGTAFAHADRLILIPVGKKVPFRAVKIQHLFDGSSTDRSLSTLGLGVGTSIELEISYDQRVSGESSEVLDVAYNLSDPIINYGPGISFGVRDLLDNGSDRRYAYLAITFQQGQDGELNQDAPAEGTVGIRTGERGTNFFFGATVPYSTQLGILAEMDSTGYFTGGLEFRPAVGAQIRWLHRPSKSYWTVGYLMRF